MDEEIEASLTRLRVLRLEETYRVQRLDALWAYYDQTQNDHLDHDWDGYKRTAHADYLTDRLAAKHEGRRYQPQGAESVPYGYRRPTCPTMITGLVVDTYTALLLGEGRSPSLRVVGDAQSTEALEALFEHSGSWAALQGARKTSGSVGAVAVVPEIVDGVPTLRVLDPRRLYIEWSNAALWIPELVIEQRLVEIERLDEDSGQVYACKVWRTRAWTKTHVYVYQDVPEHAANPSGGSDDPDQETVEPDIELDGEPVPHGAGRCPVVWIQNTHSTEDPYGDPDCEPVFEQIDRLDKLQSMIARGAVANVDPTLVVKDKERLLARWPTRRKGYGQMMEFSEVGDAKLLEISGKSFETSWLTYEKIRKQVDTRVGVITIDPAEAGAVLSGLAIRLLYRTQDIRAGERRTPLGLGIMQLGAVWLSLLRTWGVKQIGEEGKGIELPPREVTSQVDDGDELEDVVELEPHVIGPGRAVVLNWPGLHSASPSDVLTTMQGLSLGTGGQAVLSQESGVAVAVNLLELDTDVATELARITAERETKVADFDDAMRPDIEGDLLGEDSEDELPADIDADGNPIQGADTIQETALNGAQTKALFDALVRADVDLAPESVWIGIRNAFPAIDETEARRMVDAQVSFAKAKQASQPTPPPVDPQQRAAGLAKAQAKREAPDDDPEDDGEDDELA